MKILNKIVMVAVLLVSFVSCSKDGPEGPLGPKGEQGVQGAQGIPGTDGNMILHGAGAPKATDGKIGDFYIDKSSSNLYGPKVESGWGASINLRGAKGDKGDTGTKGDKGDKGTKGDAGAKGQDGSQFLSGTASPTTQGKIGDFYFRTTTATLYGPKTAAGWGIGISLKGEKGDKGEDGRTILNGTGNPAANIGAVGDFYINTTSYTIFGPKSATGWGGGKSILGAKGDKGEATYVILSGAADPTNSIGNTGDFYFNTVTKTLFYRYFAILNSPAWTTIAKLSNTIQFSAKINFLPTDHQVHIDFDLPKEKMENSMLNVYIQTQTLPTWYPLPGFVGNNNNEFRIAFHYLSSNNNKTRVTIYRVSGNNTMTDANVRIIVTEAEVFRKISKSVDFRDFNAVNNYFQRAGGEN